MKTPVLLTGWAGQVGQAVISHLGEQYDWRFLDREPPQETLPGEAVVADITDRKSVREAVADVEVIVHLAGDSRRDAPWNSVLTNNIDGTNVIFDAAIEADVSKVVFASSNHAVGAYETDERTPAIYRDEHNFRLDGSEHPRPGNLYGVSKVAGEVLGRYYHDAHDLSVVCLRIGNVTQSRPPINYERGQAMWLSYRDCAHLIERSIEAEYGYEIVYGISDNDRKFYSIERAREVLGYQPQDNSADFEQQ